MPYSHLHRMAKANCMDDLSSADRHGNDFSELVWENGQIVVQGQSIKNRKSSNNGTNNNGKEEEHTVEKTPYLKDISTTSGPLSRPMGSGQEDELVHWLNYPLDDYSSEFFSEFHQQALSMHNTAVPVMKNVSYGGRKLEQGNASKIVKESHRSRVQEPAPASQPSPNTSFMNFSRFLRPPPLAKPDSENVDRGSDRVRTKDERSGGSCSNPVKSIVIDSTNGSRSQAGYQSKPHGAPKVDVKPSSTGVIPEKEAVPKGDCPENVGPTSSFAASTGIEPVVASSSLCSGNITRGASSDPKHRFKRRYRDSEESDYPSEDVEEESVGVRKPVTARGGMSTKRTRAAEVHNLSERKRRDRINEKMRALQELIPNCNKVDKASMLDEAIEYLKTLQLQLQIMSMGSGMFMPPMMVPPNAMQHLNAPHLQPFSQMNAGMGMGMGFGMGMVDMLQVPPLHGGQFPYSPIAAHSSVPMMGGISHQMFGHPGQGMHMSMPCAPFIPHSAGPSTHPTLLPVVSGVATCTEIPNLTMPSSSNQPIENVNFELPNRNAECPQNQTSVQCQETKESFKQSDLEQIQEQPVKSN
ncbi:ATP-dependent DNA helicase pif3 [Ranunculus cassubicifolius]